MDALLVTFLACLLCETGGALQMLAIALSRRYACAGLLILGLVAAGIANAALAAWGGALLVDLMAPDARSLFLAITLLLGGVGLLLPVKQPDSLDRWSVGALPTAFLGLFILGFGNGAQFIVMGMTVRTGDPSWATIGGALGTIIACMPVILLRDQPFSSTVMRYVRRMGGILLMLVGVLIGLSAIRLL